MKVLKEPIRVAARLEERKPPLSGHDAEPINLIRRLPAASGLPERVENVIIGQIAPENMGVDTRIVPVELRGAEVLRLQVPQVS